MNQLDRAHYLVARAKRTGELVVPAACSECGREGVVHAAHVDYSQPLNVQWLCRSCHSRWDKRSPKSDGAWRRPNDERFNLWLSGPIAREIQVLARREHRTVTAQIEHLLESALEQLKVAA